MAKIIGLIQVKGGAGRSTLATNIAGELSKRGPTVLIDSDMPQGTSASWYSIRRTTDQAGDLITDTARDHQDLIGKTERYAKTAQYIVLDGPPRIAEMTRAILMLSDVCLLPVAASVAEIWATSDVLAIIEQARQVRPVDVRLVWTRHRAHTTLARELGDQVKAELPLPRLKTQLGLRVAYVEALGAGLTVAETADPAAREELHQLMAEIGRILR